MHGPYAAKIELRRADGSTETLEVSGVELANESSIVNTAARFYGRVGGTTLHDAETLGVFYTAVLLEDGDEADIAILGYEGRGERYATRTPDGRVVARSQRARRDRGRLVTTRLPGDLEMAVLTPPRVSTARFTREPGGSMFVAEASDLGRDFRLGQVYDDACDVGFTLVSQVTRAELVVASLGETRDAERELLYEDFGPIEHRSADGRRLPIPAVSVRIFND